MDTSELIRRDRGNHRLNLDRLEELPTTVLAQVGQPTCTETKKVCLDTCVSPVEALTQNHLAKNQLRRMHCTHLTSIFQHSALPGKFCPRGTWYFCRHWEINSNLKRNVDDITTAINSPYHSGWLTNKSGASNCTRRVDVRDVRVSSMTNLPYQRAPLTC